MKPSVTHDADEETVTGREGSTGDVRLAALRGGLLVFGGYILLLCAAHPFMRAETSKGKYTCQDVLVFACLQIAVCFWAVFGVGVYGIRGRRMLSAKRWSWPWLARSLGIYLVAAPLVYGATFANELVVGKFRGETPKQRIVQGIQETRDPVVLALLIGFGVLIAPVTEEVVYRGFLQGLLRPLCGTRAAIAVAAACFSLVHGEAGVVVPLFMLGLLLGWLYERAGHIGVPIVVHAAHNALTFALMFYFTPG